MCAERVCEAAFIASVLETQHLRDAIIGESLPVPGFEDAMMSLGQKLPGKLEKAITTTSISIGRMQRGLSQLLHEATSVRLLTDADERGKARLHEVTISNVRLLHDSLYEVDALVLVSVANEVKEFPPHRFVCLEDELL